MAKDKKLEPTLVPEAGAPTTPELEPTSVPEGLVAVRLKTDALYGRVVVGSVVVEHSSVAYIPNEEFERLAEKYDLELAE